MSVSALSRLRAIPTVYRGVHMRSKLEARTAASMDAYGIEWEYESQGYDLGEGVLYLPDFWCPRIKTFVECKGVMTPDDLRKVDLLARLANGLPRRGLRPVTWSQDPDEWSLLAGDAVRVVVVTDSFQRVAFAPAMCGEWAYDGWNCAAKIVGESLLSGVGKNDDCADLARCGKCGAHSWYPRWWTWACVACGLGAGGLYARDLQTRMPPLRSESRAW